MKFTTVRIPEKAARQLKRLAKKYDTNQGKLVAALVDREISRPATEAPAIPANQLNLPLI